MSVKTRSQVQSELFGAPQQLSGLYLPTYEDVMRHYKWVEFEIMQIRGDFHPPAQEIAQSVADRVEEIWKSSSVPAISNRGILQGILRFHQRCRDILKHINHESPAMKAKVECFKEKAKHLFDVAQCKCLPRLPTCVCKPEDEIDPDEIPFILDQRSDRLQAIGEVDRLRTLQMRKQAAIQKKRIVAAAQAEEKAASALFSSQLGAKLRALCSKQVEEGENVADSEWKPPSRPSSRCSSRNSLELPASCRVAERFNIPSGAASALVTATLEDVGRITPEDMSLVVDRHKFTRQRKKFRGRVIEEDLEKIRANPPAGLCFDGRRDETKVRDMVGTKVCIRSITEEHVVLVGQPGDVYLGHVSPEDGSAVALGDAAIEYLTEVRVSTAALQCVGCDGCGVNIGWKGGAIHEIEVAVGRPLSWFVCMLHGNELPLRHVIVIFDGPTSGPRDFTGPIGKQLKSCLDLPVVKFTKISLDLPDGDLEAALLSTDQKYCLEMARAIANGNCPEELAQREPGPTNHSRWVTTANRWMRVYIGTKRPSAVLKNITVVIMKVYVPMWFRIKKDWQCTEGARHVFESIQRAKEVPKAYRDVMHKYIQNNAYFAHPENVLLSMVTDERPQVRRLGIERIIKARQVDQGQGAGSIRPFQIPKLNFKAKEYTELINWDTLVVTPPPVLSHISTAGLQEMVQDAAEGQPPVIDVLPFPCHTQSVERHIKIVTEAAQQTSSHEDREGNIRQKIRSRLNMPKFATKKDYTANQDSSV